MYPKQSLCFRRSLFLFSLQFLCNLIERKTFIHLKINQMDLIARFFIYWFLMVLESTQGIHNYQELFPIIQLLF